MNETSKVLVTRVPSPPPPPAKVVIEAPLDAKRKQPKWPTLHLSEDDALELYAVLGEALGA